MKNVLKKLIAIQSELKCRKDKKATNYKYRSAEDILENLKPILANANCTIVISDDVEVIGDESYYKSTITLYDCDSEEMIENHSYVKEGEAKFMSVWQYSGATISYCRKYALCGLFSIDDWEDLDSVEDKKTEKSVIETMKEGQMISKEVVYNTFKQRVEEVNYEDPKKLEGLVEEGRRILKFFEGEKRQFIIDVCTGMKEFLEGKQQKWQ